MDNEQQELAIIVTGKDVSATRTLKNVNRELNKLPGIAGKAGRNMARNLERTVIAGAVATAGAIGYAVNAAGDFEAQLNTINTIARATPEGLTAIGDTVREIARDTGTPLEELTQGYYDLLSAGIKTADAQGVLLAANKLAIGGLATTAETVDLLTTAINTYGGDASKAGQYADEFAKAVERGKVTADEIANSYATVGPLAASLNIENKELAAGYARLTSGGTAAGEASTQMASAMTALLKKSAGLKALEKQTGKNYAAIAGKQGLAFAFDTMRKDADKAGIALINLVGRKEALLYILQATGPNMAAYNADLAAMGTSAGTAAEQMALRQKGLNFELTRLKANVTDAAITIGTELLPVFADLAEEGTAWLRGHQPEIKAFAKDLAAGIREAVEWARKLDWDAIARALQSGAGAAKAIAEAFLGLPAPIQQLLATGFVANKVTGGAVGDVAGLALKTVFRSLAIQAGVVNVSGGVVNGGGLPGGGGVPAGGGGLLGSILKVTIVGMAAGVIADFLLEASKGPAAKAYHDMGGNGTRGFVPSATSGIVHHNDPRQPQRVALSERVESILADQAASMDALEAGRLELVTKAQETTAAVNNAKISQVAATRTGDAAVVAAIRALNLSPTINLTLPAYGGSAYTRRVTTETGTTLVRVGGNAARGAGLGA